MDLIFFDLPCGVSRFCDPIVRKDVYHPALEIDFTFTSSASTTQFIYMLNYKCNIFHWRTDINKLYLANEHIKLNNEDYFNKYIKANSPLKRFEKSPFPRKKTLHRIYKITWLENDYFAFARARTTACRARAIGCYNAYISHVDKSVSTNPKVFWDHINNLRQNDIDLSRTTFGDNSESSDPNEMFNLLARHFSSVSTGPVQNRVKQG